jgi:hypothetical protein
MQSAPRSLCNAGGAFKRPNTRSLIAVSSGKLPYRVEDFIAKRFTTHLSLCTPEGGK